MFEWNTQLSVEVKEIDVQHKELLDIVSKTLQAIQSGNGAQALNEALDILSGHVEGHFKSEEAFMSRYRYPGYKSHKQEHEEIKGCIASIKKYYAKDAGNEMLCRELRGFMNYYILKHMVMTDKAMGDFLKVRMSL